MRYSSCFLSCWISLALLSTLDAQSVGSISGVLRDETGAAIPNATVVWFSPPQRLPGNDVQPGPITRGYGTTDAQGQFTATSLVPAAYVLCATANGNTYVSSCEWRSGQSRVDVRGGETNEAKMILQRGRKVTIKIADAAGRLANAPLQVIASSTDGSFAHARLVSRSATSVQLSLTVPPNVELMLNVDSPLPMSDDAGKAIATGRPTLAVKVNATDDVTVPISVN